MRSQLIAAVACAAAISLPQSAADGCPLTIRYAALQSTGAAHSFREYVAYLDGLRSEDVAVSFSLGVPDRPKPLRVERVPLSPVGAVSRPGRAVLFVVPRTDVVDWIRIEDVRQSGGDASNPCDDSKSYVIRPTNLTHDFSFDDTASWIEGEVTALEFTAPTLTSLLLPDYTSRAHRKNLEGDVRVVAAIGTDGTVRDAEVVDSSGSRDLDDIAVAAALRLRFNPARLPVRAGGALVDSVEDLAFTFTPGMTTVRADRPRR